MKTQSSMHIALIVTVVLLAHASPLHAASLAAPTHITAKPGEITEVDNLSVVVLGWDEIMPSQFNKPDDGQKFIAVEAIVINNSDTPVSIASIGQGTLRDAESQKYNTSLSANIAASLPQLGGVLLPGERLRGYLGFEIPIDAMDLEFRFVPALFGSDDELRVALPAKPAKVKAPATIPGETAPKAGKIGEPQKSDVFTITVNKAALVASGMMKPAKGNRFVVIDVTVTNDSRKKTPLSTALQMYIKDADGFRYGVNIGASVAAKAKLPDGELAAGDKIKGQVGFEVPTSAKGLMFEFTSDLFNNDKVLVTLPELK